MGWTIAIFLAILLGLQSFIYFQFIAYLKTTRVYKPSYRWWTLLLFLFFLLPFITISIIGGRSYIMPEWLKYLAAYPFYIWMGATFFIAVWLLIGKMIKLPFQIPVWILKLIKPVKKKIADVKNNKAVSSVNLSRRRFVRYATMGISAYAFGGAAYGIVKNSAYEIERKEIMIAGLPQEFKGTTITLISDIHSGQYMDENDMRMYADIVNSLGSDIICIPGDFINFDVKEVYPMINAFRGLKAKYGVYGSMGNHDFFMNADYVAKAITNESPIKLLRNEHTVINIKGKDLYMLGVDDIMASGAKMDEVLKYYADLDERIKTSDAAYNSAPKILMCHKPYGFDTLAQRQPDLVLSGHTHGGQVVPFKNSSINISFASTVSKYIDGHYKIGNSNMYVSRGLGSVALPIRLNCPPEITVITLV